MEKIIPINLCMSLLQKSYVHIKFSIISVHVFKKKALYKACVLAYSNKNICVVKVCYYYISSSHVMANNELLRWQQ